MVSSPDLDRLMSKVVIDPATSCWNWTGAQKGKGYSAFYLDGRCLSGHRAAFILLRGPIPDGLQIDHLCRNRLCVNPDHMEPVTPAENTRRGEGWAPKLAQVTHCPAGHAYDEANTYRRPGSTNRECRKCRCAVVQRNKSRQR